VPSPVPNPVAAAIGIVPAVVAHARRLPGKAVQLPVFAVSSALTALDTVRREYGDLVERGEQLLARLRGTPLEEFEDMVQDVAAHSPFAGAYDGVEDPLDVARTKASTIGTKVAGTAARAGGRVEDAADAIVGTAQDAARAGAAAGAKTTAAAGAGSNAGALPAHDTLMDAPAPKGAATAKATEPDSTRIDSAATPDVVEMADAVAAFSDVPEVGSHDELPLPDYDHMTLGSLRGRLRSLDVAQLVQLRDYEKAHADRLPVITMLDNRIAKLATDASATPSPGTAGARTAPSEASRSKVGGPSAAKTGGAPRTKVRTT